MKTVLERFLEYVQIDTKSIPDRQQVPSTDKQKYFAELLGKELREMGAEAVRIDSHGYVYASIPATPGYEDADAVGLIAHMDTSPAISGANVHPRVISNYDGKDISLNESCILSPSEFPELLRYVRQDLVVTDGKTLLGADDKAGIAEIMTAAQRWLMGEGAPHGPIKIGFTPDEEVGRGADFFSVDEFGAKYAYTVDGGGLGELEYENFNAASLKLTIHGKSIHPGAAKGKMRNALELAMEFHKMLPIFERPEFTEGYEGFYHLDELSGSVEEASAEYIIRDHDRAKFEEKKSRILKICDYLNEKYGESVFVPLLADSYYNMKEQIEPHFFLIEYAKQAMHELDINPIILPIRGGTDGSRLSYLGLPCPNLCTGGHNFHGRFEYIAVQSMEQTTELLLKLPPFFCK